MRVHSTMMTMMMLVAVTTSMVLGQTDVQGAKLDKKSGKAMEKKYEADGKAIGKAYEAEAKAIVNSEAKTTVIGDLDGHLYKAMVNLKGAGMIKEQASYYKEAYGWEKYIPGKVQTKLKDLQKKFNKEVKSHYSEWGHFLPGWSPEDYHWSGGKSTLVFTGNAMGHGPDDIHILSLVQRLQKEAANAGGRVEFMLGDQEIKNLVGNFTAVHPWSMEETGGKEGRKELLSMKTDLGRWLRKCKSVWVPKNKGFLYTHGGFTDKTYSQIKSAIGPEKFDEKTYMDELNSAVGRVLAYQGSKDYSPVALPEPSQKTKDLAKVVLGKISAGEKAAEAKVAAGEKAGKAAVAAAEEKEKAAMKAGEAKGAAAIKAAEAKAAAAEKAGQAAAAAEEKKVKAAEALYNPVTLKSADQCAGIKSAIQGPLKNYVHTQIVGGKQKSTTDSYVYCDGAVLAAAAKADAAKARSDIVSALQLTTTATSGPAWTVSPGEAKGEGVADSWEQKVKDEIAKLKANKQEQVVAGVGKATASAEKAYGNPANKWTSAMLVSTAPSAQEVKKDAAAASRDNFSESSEIAIVLLVVIAAVVLFACCRKTKADPMGKASEVPTGYGAAN